MESLKIAVATDWFFPSYGGIEYHVHDLSTKLTEAGHEVHVITRIGDYPDDELPYHVHRFRGDFNLDRLHVSMGPTLLRAVNELYKREKFDITHAHSIFSPLAVGVANLSSGIRGVPSIITDHSLMNRSVASPVYRLILRHSLGKINAFIAVSDAVKEDLERILGRNLRGRPIYVIPNAIDTDFWKEPEEGEKEMWKKRLGLKGVVITTTSRLTRKKRADALPYIAREVLERTTKDVTFVLIGDGPLREKIVETVRRLGLQGKVLLLGRLPREKVREYLWATDVYFSPTIYEAFGIAVLEALATGVPVVAFNHGGVRELVENGRTGYLVSSDAEAAQRISELVKESDLRERISKRCRASILGRYDWDFVLRRVVWAYEETLKGFKENYYLLYRIHQRIVGGRKL